MNTRLFILTLLGLLVFQGLGCLEQQYLNPYIGECQQCDFLQHTVSGGNFDLCVCEFGFIFDPKIAECVEQNNNTIPLNEKIPKNLYSKQINQKSSELLNVNLQNKSEDSKEQKNLQNGSNTPAFSSDDKNLRKEK